MEIQTCLRFIIYLLLLRCLCLAKLKGFNKFGGFDFFSGTLNNSGKTIELPSPCMCWKRCFVMPQCNFFAWKYRSEDTVICQLSEGFITERLNVITPHSTYVFGVRSSYLYADGMYYLYFIDPNAPPNSIALLKTNFQEAQRTCRTFSNFSISVYNTEMQLLQLRETQKYYGHQDFFVNLDILRNGTSVWGDGKPFEEIGTSGKKLSIQHPSKMTCSFFINKDFKISCDNEKHYFVCQRNFDKPSI